MELFNYLQENTNQVVNKNLKCNILKDYNKNLSKIQYNSNSKSLENNILVSVSSSAIQSKDFKECKYSTENLEKDVSMLSIHDENKNNQYYLPMSSNLKDLVNLKRFSSDVVSRRNLNREDTQDCLNKYGENISKLSYDSDTGDVMVLEILDYMQELECNTAPLGSDFLEGTNISPNNRNKAINWLYSLAMEFSIERYSVHHGIAIADRYIKAMRSNFKYKQYKYIILTSWYIACKWDLIIFPSLKDICALSQISNLKMIHEFEIEILKVVNFYIGIPSPILFLRPLTILKQRESISHNIAKCLVEICIQSYELAGHPAHIIASVCYCLSMSLSFRKTDISVAWIPLIKFVTGLDIEDIRPVVATLANIIRTTDFKENMPYVFNEYEIIFGVLENRKADLCAISQI